VAKPKLFPKAEAQAKPLSSLRCAHIADGHQCQSSGSLSRTTQGGGPWYCRLHFSERDALEAQFPALQALR
jgi:hypothetical protein